MSLGKYRRLSIIGLALFGAALGAVGGYWLCHVSRLRAANVALSTYASELVDHANEYGAELRAIKLAFNPSAFPFCSTEEISKLRELAFHSLQVKDIGRLQNGKLVCSGWLGKLADPWSMPQLTMTLPGGTQIYADIPLAIAGHQRGVVLAQQGVDVVLSPNAFERWDRPGMRNMVVMVNFTTRQIVRITGDAMELDPALILSEGHAEIGGKTYYARCSRQSALCVVAEGSTQIAASDTPWLQFEYIVMGALAGFGLSLAAAQFYLQRIGLARQLRRAVRHGRLSLVYQPIIELPSGSCAGAEALLRWSDDDGNAIAPDFFIRIAEDRGFIGEITEFLVRRSIQDVGDILRNHPELTLSLNIAPADLQGEALFQLLDLHVRQAGIHPRQVALEITERSTADIIQLREAVLRLHMDGYQVHIDDFGTGYSSLAYLHELAVDVIKIDRAFTRTIGTDAVTASILPQILALATSLHVEVIVEGVETEEQASYLTATGSVMQVQGWYYGKPVQAADLPKYKEDMAHAAEVSLSSLNDHGSRKA
ncbi:sensor c-di-GMP phosphodiesterase-like protein [Granulicella aggregans]|uniref:cyclic-guanylate-specific phosphodiesterase n=1 Tax=Granulicella aggregans TaxID=474949 RepID=A0A7W7ZDB9_9BACT|nr:EAL domain-containing protein [Granulicella aggregans]MBB5057820.1 sensor c-di-GMP phosphodiesterase-like protein [Granulicella aggregans]